MKRKLVNMYLGAAAVAVMGMTVPAMAAEPAETVVEAEAEKDAAAEVKLEVNGSEVTILNETETEVTSAQAEKSADGETEEGTCTVTLAAEDGTHTFENVMPEKWTEPKLIEDHGFLYIRYTEADGSSRDASETAEAVTPEEELTMWSVANVNMREETNADSKIVQTVGLGDECKVLEILPGWYHVEYNGASGYVNHKYLSDNKEDADAAVERENAAQQAAAAAAAAAAAQNATYSYSYSDSGSGSGNSGGGGGSAEECLTNGLLN